MTIRTLGRLGAAATLAVGLLIATAVPASATAHDITITASSTMAMGTATTEHFGGHATSNVCAANSTTAVIPSDLDSSGGGTIGAANLPYVDWPFWSSTLKRRFVINSGTIAITASTVTIALSITIEYRTCDSQTLVCRTLPVSVTLSGSNPGGSVHPGASATFTVAGTSTSIITSINPPCNAIIRAAIHGFPMNLSLNLHLTT